MAAGRGGSQQPDITACAKGYAAGPTKRATARDY